MKITKRTNVKAHTKVVASKYEAGLSLVDSDDGLSVYLDPDGGWFTLSGRFNRDFQYDLSEIDSVQDMVDMIVECAVSSKLIASADSIDPDYMGRLYTICSNVYDQSIAASSDAVMGNYYLDDSHGAHQAGCDRKTFDEWWELEAYLEDNPDVMDRVRNGYAAIGELSNDVAVV